MTVQKVMGQASEWIQSVKSVVGGGLGEAEEFIRKHPVTSAVTVGGGVLAGAGITQIIRKVRKKSTKTKKSTARKTSKKRGKGRDRKFISKQKHEIRRRRKTPAKIYGKKGKYYSRKPLRKAGKSKSKKRVGKIYHTKNGQPYKIMASGKARFIKRK